MADPAIKEGNSPNRMGQDIMTLPSRACASTTLAPIIRRLPPVALAVVIAGGLPAIAFGQVPPPSSQIPEKIEPQRPPPPKEEKKEDSKHENGVIQPPSGIDPNMEAKPPESGSKMPVIPPPGSPGGKESVKPK